MARKKRTVKEKVAKVVKRPSPSSKKSRRQAMTTMLSPCARDYAYALRDPFDGPLSCVPSSFPPLPSFKTRVFSRGTLTIGTNGYGFVIVNPQAFMVNDETSVFFSGSTYTGTGFPAAVNTTGTSNASSNSPFSAADLGENPASAQFRIVSVGVRTWYIGTELNLSGQMIGLRQPDNDSVLGLLVADVLGFDSARRVTTTSERVPLEVMWIPTQPRDLEYTSEVDTSFPCMGVLASGVAQSFYAFEVYATAEFIGRNVTGKSPSHADPSGFAAVLTAAQSAGDSWVGSARDAGLALVRSAAEGLSELSGPALRYAGKAAVHYGVQAVAAGLGIPVIGNMDPGSNLGGIGYPVLHGPTVSEIESLKVKKLPSFITGLTSLSESQSRELREYLAADGAPPSAIKPSS
jgi:hypothetical protein